MGDTRWLSADEQLTWRAYMSASRRLANAVESQLQLCAGIPHSHYEVLVQLSEAPGRRLRMNELAQRSLMSKSRLTHAVARLEDRGWVRRVDCPTDRRGQVAELTEAGFAGIAGAAPSHVEMVRSSLFDALTPEQTSQLRTICEAVNTRLDDSPTGG